jgi:hypothetical protein
MMHTGENDAKLKIRLLKSSPFEAKRLVEFIRRGIPVIIIQDRTGKENLQWIPVS